MNKHIYLAEEWIDRLNNLANQKTTVNDLETIKTHRRILKWLVKKAKLVEDMDKALEFYANERNHEYRLEDPHVDVYESEVMKDDGELARKSRKTHIEED